MGHVLLRDLQLLQLLLLLLRQAYLGAAEVEATYGLLLDELVLAGWGAVLQLGAWLVAVLGSDLRGLGCQELGVLAGVLSGLHALQLALRAHVLAALCQPLLHDEPALLSSLYGSVASRSTLVLILASLALGRRRGADGLVLADCGQGALAVGLAMIHELVVARPRRIASVHIVLMRAVRTRLPMRRQGAQVNLLGLLGILVRLLASHSSRHLLKLPIALLYVTLMASTASGLSRLRNDLLCLLRLGAVVRLPRWAVALD